ncbi:hypothetical protein [Methanobrevibacter sp.]|uniref:hypothetical protein n=1 Tax=Methanobrevibacter sp. TaxID=66852 RepID=UPI00388D924C
MVNIKELKSVELSSFTIISTGIAVLFAIISSILLTLVIGITNASAIGVGIYLIPTIVVGTLMYTIYNSFFEGFIYNTLAKYLKTIKFAFNDKEIVKVTTTETAIITSMIATIQVILLYLVSVFVLPLIISASMQTLMYAGQTTLAYTLYQLLVLISQPTTIAMVIFGTFIITFVYVLLACYIYNLLANSGRGILVNLSKENNLTVIESIDMMRFAIVFGIITGILSLISGIIGVISGGTAMTLISSAIGGLVSGLVEGALFAIFYNFLAPKLGKLKLELIDF